MGTGSEVGCGRSIRSLTSAADVEAIITHAHPRSQLALRTLAETGIRIGELLGLKWGDLDEAHQRFRIASGKTAAARRWVPVSPDLLAQIIATVPPDDRTPTRRIFQQHRNSLRSAMTRACQRAGTSHYHPHDLRHRWASVQVKRGVPITEISAALGHADKALTLNTYSHVLTRD